MKVFWPEEFENFEQRELLGVGQYGIVYRVFNPARNEETVLKLIETSEEAPKSVIARFQREIKSLQKLHSPHIVQMYQYWLASRFIAFEMEYIPGISLEKLLKKMTRCPVKQRLKIADAIILQLAGGLAHLHKHRLVHRDLKPSNILIQFNDVFETDELLLDYLADGEFVLKITDLGVVKDLSASVSITRSNDFVGTAAYISPEQARSERITPAADMYALGVIWYELLSGSNPFKKKNIYQTIEAHLYQSPPPLNTGTLEKEHLILSLLNKHPHSRRYSAEEVREFFENGEKFSKNQKVDFSLVIEKSGVPALPSIDWQELSRSILSRRKDTSLFVGVLPEDILLSALPQNKETDPLYFWWVTGFGPAHFSLDLARSVFKLWRRLYPGSHPEIDETDSLLMTFSKIFSLESFKEQYQQVSEMQGKIPSYMLLYYLIRYLKQLLQEIGQQKPICLIIENAPEIIRDYSYILLPLILETRNSGIFWLLLTPHHRTDELGRLLGTYPTPAWLWPQRSEAETPEQKTNGGETAAPSGEPEKFLSTVISLYPDGCPLQLAMEILNNTVSEEPGALIEMLRQKKLRFRQRPDGEFVLFGPDGQPPNLEVIPGSLKNNPQLLKKAVMILFKQDDFAGFYLGGLLQLLALEPDFADEFFTTLANFYSVLSDYPSLRKVYGWLENNGFKLKESSPLLHRCGLYGLMNFCLDGKFEEFWLTSEEMGKKLSGKEKKGRQFLHLLQALTAVKEQRLEKARMIIQKTPRDLARMDLLDQYLFIAETAILLRTDNPPYLEQKLSDFLNDLNSKGEYWNLPTATLLLAIYYQYNHQHEKAYKNAALAFTAGQYLNDYWVMRESAALILKNSYYEQNSDSLVDWQAISGQLIELPEPIFGKIEFRNLLFYGLLSPPATH